MGKLQALVGGGVLCAAAALGTNGCSPEREFHGVGHGGEGHGGEGNASGGAVAARGGTGSGGRSSGSGGGGASSNGGKPGAGGTGTVDGGSSGDGEGGMPTGEGGTPPAGGQAGSGGPEPVNPCAMDPCVNGGVCKAEGTKAVCSCDPAYEGEFCEKDVDDCAAKPCLNGGACVDAMNGYSCSCLDGFSGVNCERVVSGCDDEPCLNDSTCVPQGSGYSCTCKAGYDGTNCATNIDECASGPCKNGGACNDGVNAYTCTCKAGYSGANCETNIDDCANSPCKNGGTCTDGVNAYTCSCTSRYTGTNCEYLEVKLVPSDFFAGWATRATALSNDGTVLLMNATKGSEEAIARLVDFGSANTVTPPAPYVEGRGFGLNSDGGVIVGSFVQDNEYDDAFKMVGSVGTILDLSTVGWGTAIDGTGRDVSADGSVIVGTVSQAGGTGPFYCKTGQSCREVPVDQSGIEKLAVAVSGDGTIVVGYTSPADPTVSPGIAYRWVTSAAKAVPLSLGSSSWTYPRALGISRNGQVIVGSAQINGVTHAIRWSGASFTPEDLGTGWANATSSDGSVTVGVDGTTPVVWIGTTRNTLSSLIGSNPDLSGATLIDAIAISDDGKVVAATATVSGVARALMVRLP